MKLPGIAPTVCNSSKAVRILPSSQIGQDPTPSLVGTTQRRPARAQIAGASNPALQLVPPTDPTAKPTADISRNFDIGRSPDVGHLAHYEELDPVSRDLVAFDAMPQRSQTLARVRQLAKSASDFLAAPPTDLNTGVQAVWVYSWIRYHEVDAGKGRSPSESIEHSLEALAYYYRSTFEFLVALYEDFVDQGLHACDIVNAPVDLSLINSHHIRSTLWTEAGKNPGSYARAFLNGHGKEMSVTHCPPWRTERLIPSFGRLGFSREPGRVRSTGPLDPMGCAFNKSGYMEASIPLSIGGARGTPRATGASGTSSALEDMVVSCSLLGLRSGSYARFVQRGLKELSPERRADVMTKAQRRLCDPDVFFVKETLIDDGHLPTPQRRRTVLAKQEPDGYGINAKQHSSNRSSATEYREAAWEMYLGLRPPHLGEDRGLIQLSNYQPLASIRRVDGLPTVMKSAPCYWFAVDDTAFVQNVVERWRKKGRPMKSRLKYGAQMAQAFRKFDIRVVENPDIPGEIALEAFDEWVLFPFEGPYVRLSVAEVSRYIPGADRICFARLIPLNSEDQQAYRDMGRIPDDGYPNTELAMMERTSVEPTVANFKIVEKLLFDYFD